MLLFSSTIFRIIQFILYSVLCTEYYKNYIVTTTPSNTIALDSSKFDTWSNRWMLCNYEYMNISAQWSHLNTVAPIPFFITNLILVCKFWVSADTDPIPVLFFFLIMIEYLYICVWGTQSTQYTLLHYTEKQQMNKKE